MTRSSGSAGVGSCVTKHGLHNEHGLHNKRRSHQTLLGAVHTHVAYARPPLCLHSCPAVRGASALLYLDKAALRALTSSYSWCRTCECDSGQYLARTAECCQPPCAAPASAGSGVGRPGEPRPPTSWSLASSRQECRRPGRACLPGPAARQAMAWLPAAGGAVTRARSQQLRTRTVCRKSSRVSACDCGVPRCRSEMNTLRKRSAWPRCAAPGGAACARAPAGCAAAALRLRVRLRAGCCASWCASAPGWRAVRHRSSSMLSCARTPCQARAMSRQGRLLLRQRIYYRSGQSALAL